MISLWQELSLREKTMLTVGFLVILFVFVFLYILKPLQGDISDKEKVFREKQNQLQILEPWLQRPELLTDGLGKAETRFEQLNQVLPSQGSPEVILAHLVGDWQGNIQGIAKKTGVELTTLSIPKNQGASTNSGEKYLPIQINTVGTYDQTLAFIDEIKNLSRLNHVKSCNMNRSPNGTYKSSLVVHFFYQ